MKTDNVVDPTALELLALRRRVRDMERERHMIVAALLLSAPGQIIEVTPDAMIQAPTATITRETNFAHDTEEWRAEIPGRKAA